MPFHDELSSLALTLVSSVELLLIDSLRPKSCGTGGTSTCRWRSSWDSKRVRRRADLSGPPRALRRGLEGAGLDQEQGGWHPGKPFAQSSSPPQKLLTPMLLPLFSMRGLGESLFEIAESGSFGITMPLATKPPLPGDDGNDGRRSGLAADSVALGEEIGDDKLRFLGVLASTCRPPGESERSRPPGASVRPGRAVDLSSAFSEASS
mmetsp:Transcript_27418/g.74360  ORF Transcript_27418/g.74360 Transcript_27418/m.74360 type:complete len:207 (+) Transcript_27418:737-1357(+)